MVIRHLVLAGIVLTCAAVAGAHDFWLIPNAFAVAPGADVTVHGQTSSAFPRSESAVTTDRLTLARVFGTKDDEPITALSTRDRSLVLRHRPRTPGQKIIAASLDWRTVNETAESFRKYLVLEGAEDALRRYEQAGALPTAPIVRRYAKYAKTVVEFGRGPRAYDRVVGQPLEFVPLADPNDARASARLSFRLLFQGRALAGARVHAEIAPPAGSKAPVASEVISRADGTVDVALTSAGLWNVRTIHVVPAPKGVGADWEVHWATFVFEVK